jgi:nucleotide-binding universal stress UspA family protein
MGEDAESLSSHGRFHDLIALAGGPERSGRLIAADIGEVVVTCGRPVLLAPEKASGRSFKTIAVAWKNAAEAARAVTAAMPFLSKAKRIEVLGANEGADGSLECVNCSDSLVRQLQWHGLNARGHFVVPAGRSIPDAILETAREREADLLVMGAYGHSRLREFVFGGFTRHVLDGVSLPVLLFH